MHTVFLSSVGKDLRKFRDAAYHAVEGLDGYHCVRMEDFGSWDIDPDDFCRSKVGQCDLFLCLAGPLYGSLTPAGPSYTEREFDAAQEFKKTCLVFLTTEDFLLPVNLREPDDRQKRQETFRHRISGGRIVTRFAEPDELARYVIQAIRNWEANQPAASFQISCRLRLRKEDAEAHPMIFSVPFISVGRGPQNLVRVDDPEVSWEQGQIVFERGMYYYRNLGNTNPSIIFRRGKLVELAETGTTMLQTQDRLILGKTTFIVEFDLVDVDKGYTKTTPRPKNDISTR
jgi:Domain of unknown function (DUF4062)/FHA domain